MSDLGKALMLLGACVFIVGILLILAGRLPWFGRLPGDIVVERGPVTIYFPLMTSILVSVLLSFLLWLFRR
jgi:hypothetical protein